MGVEEACIDEEKSASGRKPAYSVGEEIANTVTHGVGAGLAIAALVILVVFASRKGDPWRIVSFSIYGATLVMLYMASTLYHAFPWPKVKEHLRRVDHASIYLLIAGTYTPCTLVCMRNSWGWTLFGIIWGLALIGVVYKAFFIRHFEGLTVVLYVAMGWLVVIALKPILAAVPLGGLLWLLGGGLCYTFGVIFYAWDRLPFNHAVWHLFVLAGSILHFFSLLLFILPDEA
ncbi:MAG TPA: hemolysin III family protein [Candidatus Hydrogenedentes bacterium]|nr:hemolysin III family protein [Candidatus Hydrogenedentota bacterium]HPG66355.1 hemolysin III family protein [Candidatus Hydrogenedentota bacterium]